MQNPASITRLLLYCGIAAPVALVVFVAWAAAVTPDYSHIANTISQLAAQGRPHPAIMGSGFLVFGLLVDGFALGLYRTLGHRAGALGVLLGLLVFGTFVALSGPFQDYNEAPGVPRNMEGHLHSLFAQISVVGLLVAMFFLSRVTYGWPGWDCLPWVSLACAVAVAGVGLTFMALPASVQGLLQRGLYATTLAWIVIVSLTALRQGPP